MDPFEQYEAMFEQSKPLKVNCCICPSVCLDGCYMVCINCGQVDTSIIIYQNNFDQQRLCKVQYYKRLSYFREKLKLLGCIKRCNNPKYDVLIDKLKRTDFIINILKTIKNKDNDYIIKYFVEYEVIRNIRNLIRSIGYSKLFKFIYCVILDIFNFNCFHIHNKDLEQLTVEWVYFEIRFKKLYPNATNMVSYNTILKYLLIKHNIPNQELLILPNNEIKIKHMIINLI
jgi:hypothetical protein